MTTLAGRQPPLPLRPGSADSTAAGVLDTVVRHLHAFSAAWWYVPLAGLRRRLARAWAARRARRQWRYTRDLLLALDDRTLADIGLDRYRLLRTTPAEMLRHGGAADPLRTIHRVQG